MTERLVYARNRYPCITRRAGIVCCALLFSLSDTFAAQATELRLNDTNDPPLTTPAHDGFLDIIADAAFKRLNFKLHLIHLPAERALIDANAGTLDGEFTRIEGLEKQYPNLIRVPEKLVDWVFCAFSKDSSIPANWTSLRQHSVGLIKGWKIYERQMQGARRLLTANDPEQLFRLLELGRVDVILYAQATGVALIARDGLKDIYQLTPPLETREMFIYLHKRHARVALKLGHVLREMKESGFYQQVYREKLQPYRETHRP
ncbi:MAG: transporter substrate-binding domain-containing protein [Pseudomonadota bacterium]